MENFHKIAQNIDTLAALALKKQKEK